MTRTAAAKAWLEKHADVGELRVLGEGQEAVVLTDGRLVFKFFDQWRPRTDDTPSPDALVARLAESGPWQTLSPVKVCWRDDGLPLFTYPFEASEPYSGGHEEGFVTFLREATAAGFVMSNIHVDNFVVTARGLHLVDYGISFHPWTEEGFLHMARRAWLTLRCHGRGDLKVLMRAALVNPALPELDGFDAFLERVHGAPITWSPAVLGRRPDRLVPLGQEATLDPRVVSIAMAATPKTVLDYGCGKGKVTEELARRGVQVTGWDPDHARIARCRGYGSGTRYLNAPDALLAASERFDVVICSIVACIVDEAAVPILLTHLRQLVAEGGRVVFSVCHPFYSLSGCSEIHCKESPADAHYRGRFDVRSIVRNTGRGVRDLHRPWSWYVRKLAEAGLGVLGVEESEGISPETGWSHADYLIAILEPRPLPVPEVSLVLRACALEADTIDTQVRHIVRQLCGGTPIQQRIVAVDPRSDGFARAHGKPDLEHLLRDLDVLIGEGVVDEVIVGPEQAESVNANWFGLDTAATNAANGQAVAASLAAFELCRHPYIVAVDADVMIKREAGHDPVLEAIVVLDADPSGVTASLSITQAEDRPWTRGTPDAPPRVEVRAAVFNRHRLLAARPFPNGVEGRVLRDPWHRALDATIRDGGLASWRGGDRRTGFIHPPNALKQPRGAWLDVLDRLEAGFVPAAQVGQVELGSVGDPWWGPKRSEPFVFVVCGRNVEPGRLRRCLDSLSSQRGPSWGAVVIDDASDNGAAEYLDLLTPSLGERVTVLRNRRRVGMLANLHRTVHHFVADPDAVILTLDADDALIGTGALLRVASEYARGADLTVGSMRRTDKNIIYPADFSDPRGRRGGNVWQHLRTFKKRLFDQIEEDDLKLDGEWIELANDWAFMVPIAEMAEHPVQILEQLYLYEPSSNKAHREGDKSFREATIARILAKPRYTRGGGRST
jgi:hypothetical protein